MHAKSHIDKGENTHCFSCVVLREKKSFSMEMNMQKHTFLFGNYGDEHFMGTGKLGDDYLFVMTME